MATYVRMIDGMSNVTVDDELTFQTNFLNDEGIVVQSGTDLQVQAQAAPDLTVKVKTGSGYIKRDAWTANSGTLKFWEAVLDADANVTIPANNSGGTIRRIICMKIDTGVSPDANASNVASLVVVSGTSGGGDPTIPDNHLPLARIIHANADTSIASGDISDLRTVAGLKADSLRAASTNGDLVLSGNGTGKVREDARYGTIKSDTDGTTITFDMAVSNLHSVTLAGNRTLAFSNVSVGQVFMLRLKQDATGNRTVTWPSGISWAGGSAPTLTTTANKADMLGLICTGAGTYDGYVVGMNV